MEIENSKKKWLEKWPERSKEKQSEKWQKISQETSSGMEGEENIIRVRVDTATSTGVILEMGMASNLCVTTVCRYEK